MNKIILTVLLAVASLGVYAKASLNDCLSRSTVMSIAMTMRDSGQSPEVAFGALRTSSLKFEDPYFPVESYYKIAVNAVYFSPTLASHTASSIEAQRNAECVRDDRKWEPLK
jgi:hypothetical protein